jgi:transposase
MSNHQEPPAQNPHQQPAAAIPPAELPIGEYAALIGLDWGDQRHAVALWSRQTGRVERLVLEHSPERVHAWLEELKIRFGGQRVAVAVEASKGAIVAALLEHPWLAIYPIHPATSRRFGTAFTPSGAKDDLPDAGLLLEILQGHRHKLRLLVPHDPATRRLSLLVEARRTMVDRRTRLSNELTSLLKGYYPQALALTGEKRYAPLALDLVERWPDLASLQRAKAQTLRSFFYKHQVRREETIAARLEVVRTARALSHDPALVEVSILELRGLVEQIRTLNKHVLRLDAELAAEFAKFPEAYLFKDLPGAGAALAPRLSVLFGSDRQRWAAPAEMQKYFGIAPVQEKSGNQRWIHWRWNAPVFARQTLVEWAGLSVKYSPWAKAYYLQQRAKQKGHSAILRSLAFKWLRILWRCWQDRKPYDETRYLARLKERSPILFKLIPTA